MTDSNGFELRDLPDEYHEALRSQLPDYAMAVLAAAPPGGPPGAEWAAMERHLDSCAECRAELDQILQLLHDTIDGDLAQAGLTQPNLAFLPPRHHDQSPAPVLIWRSTDAFRNLLLQFTDAFASAMLRPALAGGFRSGGQGDQGPPSEYSYQLESTPPDDIDIAIDLNLTDSDLSLYRVKITVIDLHDPFDQAGHKVTLNYEARSITATTDEQGCVAFAGVPYASISQLRLAIALRPPC